MFDGHVHSEWTWDTTRGSPERTCARAAELGLIGSLAPSSTSVSGTTDKPGSRPSNLEKLGRQPPSHTRVVRSQAAKSRSGVVPAATRSIVSTVSSTDGGTHPVTPARRRLRDGRGRKRKPR